MKDCLTIIWPANIMVDKVQVVVVDCSPVLLSSVAMTQNLHCTCLFVCSLLFCCPHRPHKPTECSTILWPSYCLCSYQAGQPTLNRSGYSPQFCNLLFRHSVYARASTPCLLYYFLGFVHLSKRSFEAIFLRAITIFIQPSYSSACRKACPLLLSKCSCSTIKPSRTSAA